MDNTQSMRVLDLKVPVWTVIRIEINFEKLKRYKTPKIDLIIRIYFTEMHVTRPLCHPVGYLHVCARWRTWWDYIRLWELLKR